MFLTIWIKAFMNGRLYFWYNLKQTNCYIWYISWSYIWYQIQKLCISNKGSFCHQLCIVYPYRIAKPVSHTPYRIPGMTSFIKWRQRLTYDVQLLFFLALNKVSPNSRNVLSFQSKSIFFKNILPSKLGAIFIK